MKFDNVKESTKATQSSQKKEAATNAPATASSNKNEREKGNAPDSSNKGKGPTGENL